MSNNTDAAANATASLQAVRAFYDRLAAGDVPGVLALLHPRIEWTECAGFPYYSGTWVGPQAVLDKLLKRLAAEWEGFAATPQEYLADGARVVSLGAYSGVYKQTGKAMRADFAHRWTVENGLITSFRMFADTAKVLEALSA